MHSRNIRRIMAGTLLSAALAAGFAGSARAQMPMPAGTVTLTQTTPSYTVELDIVPAMQMLTPDQAQSATSGMVMVQMTGMDMSMGSMSMSMPMTMATVDDGQPVNHHLGVHVHDAATGALISDIMPAITIANDGTGETRTLNDVMPMYDLQAGQSDLHFGNNVYLPDGTYTITVGVGQETAVFSDVNVSGGMGLSTNLPAPVTAAAPASS